MLHRRLLFIKNIESAPLLYQVICLVGLFWQLFQICSQYFKYEVNIRTSVFKLKISEDLSMGMCIPIEFAIDYNKLNTELQSNWTAMEFQRKGRFQNLTSYQIYNYTYNADNLVYAIIYHDKLWFADSTKKNLSSFMQLEKYYFEWKMCYLYSVRFFKPLSVNQLNGGLIVALFFGKEIRETYAIRLFIAEKDRISFRETIEARVLQLDDSSMKLDNFETSHYTIREQLLPLPYETGCFSYSELNMTNSIECIKRCVVQTFFQKWGTIPREYFVPNEVIDYKLIKVSNYTEHRAELNNIELFCQSSCPNTSCEDTQIVTIYEKESHYNYSGNISIRWERKTPSIPSIIISCRPTSILIELIVYIMSSVSTWTGLSVMAINPLLLLRSLSKIMSENQILSLQLRRRLEITAINHTDRVSRLEDCLVSQSLAHEKLKEIVFYLLKDRSRSAR